MVNQFAGELEVPVRRRTQNQSASELEPVRRTGSGNQSAGELEVPVHRRRTGNHSPANSEPVRRTGFQFAGELGTSPPNWFTVRRRTGNQFELVGFQFEQTRSGFRICAETRSVRRKLDSPPNVQFARIGHQSRELRFKFSRRITENQYELAIGLPRSNKTDLVFRNCAGNKIL
nr:hypothetical protein Iba_chr13fCG7760 [Ipomoea batatas]